MANPVLGSTTDFFPAKVIRTDPERYYKRTVSSDSFTIAWCDDLLILHHFYPV